MKNILFAFIFVFLACNEKKKNTFEYYIISKEDAEVEKIVKERKAKYPLVPQEFKWYSNLVFVIDTSNVYVYQTVEEPNSVSQKIVEYRYPNFIELKPEDMITIPEKDFLSFIKANNDLLELVNKPKNRASFFQIASTTDTIKNKAFYDFEKFVGKEDNIYYKIRRATEEEQKVINCKVNHKKYEPKNILWSKQFILGNFSPITKEYAEEEKNAKGIRKSIGTLNRNSFERMYYE
jgi:hypothetical protein